MLILIIFIGLTFVVFKGYEYIEEKAYKKGYIEGSIDVMSNQYKYFSKREEERKNRISKVYADD